MPLWDFVDNSEKTSDADGELNKEIPTSSGNSIPTATPEVSTDSPNVESSSQASPSDDVELSNMPTTYDIPSTSQTSIHKVHPLENVIGELQLGVKTRSQTKKDDVHGFISEVYESKKHKRKNE